MDPLSFTASLIAVIGTVKQVKKGLGQLKGLHSAPQELDVLLDENSQFEAILKAIDKTLWESNRVGPELQTVLAKAQTKFTEFEALIQYTLTEAGTSSKVDRLQWVRRRKEVEALRCDLKDITLRIVSLVGVETNTTVSLISTGQKELSSTVSQISSGQQEIKDQVATAVSELCKKIDEDRSLQSALTGLLGQFRQTTLESGTKTDTVSAQDPESSLLQAGKSRHFGGPFGEFRVHRHQTLNICSKDCQCKCHRKRHMALPSPFGVLGRGYAEISGASPFGNRCDDPWCRAPSAPHVSIVYALPRWVAMRMILLSYSATFDSGPEYVLRVPRVVAAAERQGEMISYLMTLGVSGQTPIVEWGSTSQTFDMVLWKYFVINPNRRKHRMDTQLQDRQLLQHFDFDDFSEDLGFTTLHKIVCGIDLRDLDLEVQRYPHNIDKLDIFGRNPLWYAVTHGDTKFVRCLLERGANPNLEGSAVIIKAIRLAQLEIVELLITFGFNIADLNMDDLLRAWRYFLLRHSNRSRALISLLIRHGIDINRQTRGGTTMLMFLCSESRNDTDGVHQLIRCGVELELRNSNGETALFSCITRVGAMDLDAFLMLVRAGARLDVRDYTGATVLHHIVLRDLFRLTDLTILAEALKEVDISQLDLDARDEDGYSAFDLLKKRNGTTWESYATAKRGYRLSAWHEDEVPAIRGLESLFHQIQDLQGIPVEQQYPRLTDYLYEQTDSNPIPGAYPL